MKTIMGMALEAGFTERELIRAVENLTRFNQLVRADEREACALIAEQHHAYEWVPAVCEIAYAIRARGNT